MDAVDLVLRTVFSHRVSEPNVEAAFERFQALTGDGLDEGAFRNAIAACVRDGLMRDPVRLEEGALQCHWRAELTPAGVEAARAANATTHPTVMPGLDPGIQRSPEQMARPLDCRIKSGNDGVSSTGNNDVSSAGARDRT